MSDGRCHCGIYLTIPHEHAQGLPKIGALFLGLSEFGPDAPTALEAVDRLIVKGLLAKVGEGLYKETDRGAAVREAAAVAKALREE